MKPIRTLAMYLPQFHEVPENSAWWGEGYTEWTAVKNAVPYFSGHNQPVVPLNENYYNLLSKDTMVWQAGLAKKYGIDGFCFYHYWFGKDRKILEKPAENLLKWKDINLPFCFDWDPQTWARTWSKLGNPWADKFEQKADRRREQENGILIQQDFGDEAYWKKHFDYLLSFFQDDRYIRIDGKPIFIFHRTRMFPCLERMAAYWRKLAAKAGLPGLYLIGLGVPNRAMDAVIYPMDYGKSSLISDRKSLQRIPGTLLEGADYDDVWKYFLTVPPSSGQRTLWLGVVSYDDSPRRGEQGEVYLHVSPAKFQHYFGQLMRKSREAGNPFVFINAWNEWGEGMKLEPDVKTGYGYLEAVRDVVRTDTDELPAIDPGEVEKGRQSYVENLEYQAERNQKFYFLFRDWMRCKREGKSLARYFRERGWKKIAIYGYGRHGIEFFQDLQGQNDVKVSYLIDARKDAMDGKTPLAVFRPEEELPLCDAVVVSVIDEYDSILKILQERINMPIVSLAEVVTMTAEK